MDKDQQQDIETLAQGILDARNAFPSLTLDDLYDADNMPPTLRRAHDALDKAVDRLYRRSPFKFERDRVEHLFKLYEQSAAPLVAAGKPERQRQHARTAE